MAQVYILYPSDVPFDLDYYIKVHMPMVSSLWGPFGLLGWESITFPTGPPYQVQTVLRWKDLDQFSAASKGEAADKLFDDIQYFTTAKALILKGEVVASS
ncbi:hypothetical protein ACHAPO_011571 [Fusarium lateritium]